MNLTTIICFICLVAALGLTACRVQESLTQEEPNACTWYSAKHPYPEGGYYTTYGSICRDENGEWKVKK